MDTNAKQILKNLVSHTSISPNDDGCQAYIRSYLKNLGFQIQDFSIHDTTNTWAWYGDTHAVRTIFAGHTDVVPVNKAEWATDPFYLTEKDDTLYGRGTADMKGAIAAFMSILPDICQANIPIGIILTSDEEGDATYGTNHVTERLIDTGIKPDHILIGEPSSLNQLGDSIRIGRRGSVHFKGIVPGISGHTAYPDKCTNPVDTLQILYRDYQIILDSCQPNEHGMYPPTHLSFSSFESSYISNNVTPTDTSFSWNLRYSPFFSITHFYEKVDYLHQGLGISGSWSKPSQPYDGKKGALTDTLSHVIEIETGIKPDLNAAGGTSDGRFLQKFGCEVIEFGHINRTIHQNNEAIKTQDLSKLSEIYKNTILQLHNENNE